MGRLRLFITVIVILLVALAAGFFDFPDQTNRGVAFLSSKLPFSIPQVRNVPFQLGLDLQGGIHLVYEADLSEISNLEHDTAMEGLRDVIERRVNLFGVKEPLVQTEGGAETRRLIVELAGIVDPNQAVQLIGQTPFLEFREPKENYQEIGENNQKVFETGEGEFEDPFQTTTLTGRFLQKAQVDFDTITRFPLINLQFDDEGAKIFEDITSRNVGRPVAIYLDGLPLQAPIVQNVITGGAAQITRADPPYTIEQAQKLVRELNAGALPVPITLISQQSVGATLGQVSLEQSLKAALLGFLFVVAFMAMFYRIPGFLAVAALLIYVVLVLALFKLIPITLTLAGIAGFILSIGMAVDANILIFSRMKEELREKKSFAVSIEEGFRRAWPSIRDGNITTLFVAVILFWFGSSFVQGFALVLSLGILLSMFSAIFVTKNFLQLFVGTPLERIRWFWE